MKNIDLCEILKGHEGETFYSALVGSNVELFKVNSREERIDFKDKDYHPFLYPDGSFKCGGECMLFPSKDQRDWNKWIEEQKPKVPKTWSGLDNKDTSRINGIISCVEYGVDNILTLIEKSAFALLKIHKLIEVGYGGNADKTNEFYSISYDVQDRKFIVRMYKGIIYDNFIISFHTEKQANEFLSYTENVQLLKDYYII